MSSLLADKNAETLRGSETPRIWTYPPAVSSSGDELADYAAQFGLHLDPWQRLALRCAMAEKAGGRWAAGQVGIIVPRQNGKGSIIEARELGGLFLLNERLITHTAHQFKTASDAFRRIRSIVDGSDELTRRVKRILNSPSDKSIELMNGNKLSFIARSGGSGRGFSGDVVILDEAYDLTQDEMDALIPTLTTAPDPQVWYTSSAGKAHSEVLANIRKMGIEGNPTLAYMEWSVEESGPEDPMLDPDDPVLIAQANPGYPTRVSPDYLAIEAGALSEAGRLRERLGIWDPLTGRGMFDMAAWHDKCLDLASAITGRVSLAVEIAQDRSWACIAAAGRRSDGLLHVQVAENRPGTAWVVDKIVDLAGERDGEVWLSPNSPAGSLIEALEVRLTVHQVPSAEYAKACGAFFDLYRESGLRHIGQGELDAAIEGARKRTSSDAWVFDRKSPDLDISPLAAVVLASYAASIEQPSVYEEREVRFL
jgi:hypothetical protein